MTNYSRGASFERTVMADLKAHGYFVVRSAGSHGAVDLVAFRMDTEPWFVQVKINGKMSPKDRAEFLSICEDNGAGAIKASRPKRGQIRYEELLPNGEWREVKP